MDLIKSSTFDSLKILAGQFQKQAEEAEDEAERSREDEAEGPMPEHGPAELPALPPPEEEEYLEFPVLQKHKTYSVSVIKPLRKTIPGRETVLVSKESDLKIILKDCELFEPVAMQRELQPFVLKNSHAVIDGLESCEKITFKMDPIGSFTAMIQANDKKEELNLGCIIRFELSRENAPALIVTSRDLDCDAAVIGAPCEIEFLVEDKSQAKYEKASLKKLNEADAKVSAMNQEAGHSISWIL